MISVNCFNCGSAFEAKRSSAKFCSDNCRVKWNNRPEQERENPLDRVKQLQGELESARSEIKLLQDVNKRMSREIERMQAQKELRPPSAYLDPSGVPPIQQGPPPISLPKPLPKVAVDAIMHKYVEDRHEITCREEFKVWLNRLEEDERLSSRQKELVKQTQ